MPGTPAPITTSNILGANGRLWLNVAQPLSGTPPGHLKCVLDSATGLWTPDSVQNPNAVNFGATRAGTKLNTSAEYGQEFIDEQPSPYRIHPTKENANIEAEMMEVMDFAKLSKMISNGKLHTSAGYTMISAGGLLTLAPMCVAVIAPSPVAGEVVIFMLYSAYNALGLALNLTSKADTGMPIRLEGLGVPGRVPGDQLWHIFEGDATT